VRSFVRSGTVKEQGQTVPQEHTMMVSPLCCFGLASMPDLHVLLMLALLDNYVIGARLI